LIECSVRAVGVEVLQVFAQHDLEVAWSGDQDVVEAFPAQGADEPFGDGVVPSRRLPLIPTVSPEPSG
jgi:hypothetical protein